MTGMAAQLPSGLEQQYGALPRTWRSLTADGEHIWFRLSTSAQIRGGNNRLGHGLDVKTGPGSYVVAPPSLHPVGVRYSWRPDAHPVETPLAVAPDWLVKLLTLLPPSQPTPFTSRSGDDQRVLDALQRIPADDREVWVKVGMALQGHFGDAGRALWDDWAATSTKYDPKAQAREWRSFRRNGVTLGTIFHLARERARAA